VPLIFRRKGFAFFFVMFDLSEPIHVHVRAGRKEAKYWMEPLALAWNRGYRAHELNEIERILEANYPLILTTWHKESSKQ
jgi:hypothetical protein